MSTSTPSRLERGAPLDYDTVVAIAGDLLDESGLEGFTLGAVAERAGVTQPALYRHVDGAAALWRGLGLETRHRLANELTAAGVGVSGADAVRSVANAWRRFAQEHPGRYRSTERYPVRGDAELVAAVEAVRSTLRSSIRGFDLHGATLDHAATMLRSALHGFVSFELGDGDAASSAGEADDAFGHLVDMLCVGFDALKTTTR